MVMLMGSIGIMAANVQPLDEHYRAARLALAKGNLREAKRELRVSLQENPLHGESHFLLASVLGQEGDLDQAMVGFQRAMTLEPNNAVARYNLGTALLWRGESVAAANLFEEAVSIDPDYVRAYNNLAKAYFLAGLPELAVASYRQALQRDPLNTIARKGLAALTGRADGPTRADTASAEAPEPNEAGVQPSDLEGSLDPPEMTPASHFEPGGEESPELTALRALVRDLRHVIAEQRGGQLVLSGWTTGPNERELLDRVLQDRSEVLDLTTDDVGDPHRLLEIDATLFVVLGLDSQSVGHNFLKRVEVNASVFDGALTAFDWMYSAAITYDVNIANATKERVAFLARPHLTTLSGTPATFLAGGDIVYQVAGLNSGDIKPYPFGTSLEVTPTLLRSRNEDGSPRIRVSVKAGRKSILPLQTLETELGEGSTAFENVEVTSEAVLDLNQTLILTGLNQRERRTGRSGVPILKSIPIIKYLFSEKITITSDVAIIILLTPRDPAFWDEETRESLDAFVEKRNAYVQALKGTEEDLRRFRERYPDWQELAPNRFASHFFLMENSEAYRAVRGMDLAHDNLDFDLLQTATARK
jgi:tetratricopeptide (TPR) repeat protein